MIDRLIRKALCHNVTTRPDILLSTIEELVEALCNLQSENKSIADRLKESK